MILLLKLIEFAFDAGFNTIDLGAGGETYKQIFKNDAVALVEGTVETFSSVTTFRMLKRASLTIGRKVYHLVKGSS